MKRFIFKRMPTALLNSLRTLTGQRKGGDVLPHRESISVGKMKKVERTLKRNLKYYK
jgi:hypothetical protein